MKVFSITSTIVTIFLPIILIGRILIPAGSSKNNHTINVVQGSPEISIVNTEPITYIGLEATVNESQGDDISSTMGELYGQLMKFAEESQTETIGAPIAVYKSFGPEEIEVVCGLPVNEGYIIRHDNIEVGRTLGGKAVKATHYGSYDKLPFTHDKVNQYIKKRNLTVVGSPYELYITDPEKTPDTTQWVTEVYYPLGG